MDLGLVEVKLVVGDLYWVYGDLDCVFVVYCDSE